VVSDATGIDPVAVVDVFIIVPTVPPPLPPPLVSGKLYQSPLVKTKASPVEGLAGGVKANEPGTTRRVSPIEGKTTSKSANANKSLFMIQWLK
jgi:hypothetical protein